MVAELSRVLRPGGHLLVNDLHPAAVEWGFRSKFNLDAVFYRLLSPKHGPKGYLDAVTNAGLKTLRMTELTTETCGLGHPCDLVDEFREEYAWLPFILGILAQAS